MCPYASDGSSLDVELSLTLSRSDIGFQIATQIRRALLEYGQPRFMLLNGKPVGKVIEHTDSDKVEVEKKDYVSIDE